ncbi:hypothetical protein BY458DRAFT_513310 [Sporodiniella umbellata]|nr:hypothetical protein BY458DRAFT_513310 [Sporodiniella umbellata]
MTSQAITDLEEAIHKTLDDELLADVLPDFSLQDIDILIAVEQGQAYRIRLERPPLESVDLIVRQSSTVKDIKQQLQRTLEKMDKNAQNTSWKYIWKTYCLTWNRTKLLNDKAVVSQLGIKQNSVLSFDRMPLSRNKHHKARSWYKH